MSTSTVAIFGGAFDPVHRDHITLANLCLSLKLCDEVWFVPSPNRWDKTLFASAEHRLAMLHLVTNKEPRIKVSDVEILMGEYRGSYVSIRELQKLHPDTHFRLLVGADTYGTIPRWRDPLHFYGTEFNGHLLLSEFELIVFSREDVPMPDVNLHEANGYAPLFCVGEKQGFIGHFSSSEIRRELFGESKKPDGLAPEVYRYIIKHKLYRDL